MKKVLPLLLFFALACGTSKRETQTPSENTEKPDGRVGVPGLDRHYPPVKLPVYQATRTVLFDLIHTELHVSFDWDKSHLHGVANITLSPRFYPQDTLVLDAKDMEIHFVFLDKQQLKYVYNGEQLKIALNKTYTRSDTLTVKVEYTAKPDERIQGGSSAIAGDKGLYFINPRGENPNVMPQIWTQGETESNSVWFPTIDSPNQKMSQDLYITVADKYTTLSNGLLLSSKKNSDGSRTDHWQQRLPHAPYLTMMGIGEFKVVKDSWTRSNGKKVEVHYYVEPEWESYAKAIFGNTPEMLTFFSTVLGYEYPWDKYHQIVVRDYVSGAMENTGAVIFGDMLYSNERELLDGNWESIIAHELFHHWFGDLVTCESWSNLPLNESFANYSQFLWDEYKYGLDEAEYNAEKEAEGYFASAKSQGHHNLIWFDYSDKEQMFDGHSYNKGGRILHMLRNYLGDEAFFAGIKHYLHKHEFKPAEAHELRIAFEEVSGEDLNWFFNQWFFAKGHPKIIVEQTRSKDSVSIKITQAQNFSEFPLYKIPMTISLFDANGRHNHKIILDKNICVFSYPVKDTLYSVIPDADHVILAEWFDKKPVHQFEYQFFHGGKYADRKAGLNNLAKSKDPLRDAVIIAALDDPFYQIRIDAIKQCNRLKQNHKEFLLTKIPTMALQDKKSLVRQAAVDFLNTHYPQENITKEINSKVISSDLSYKVIGTALLHQSKYDFKGAMNMARDLEKEKSGSMMSYLASLYSEHGTAEQYIFFKNAFASTLLSGTNLYNTISSFGIYLTKQPALIQEQALSELDALLGGGAYSAYFAKYAIQNVIYSIELSIQSLDMQIANLEKERDFLQVQQKTKEKMVLQEVLKKYTGRL
jgi:aminopeptidase N